MAKVWFIAEGAIQKGEAKASRSVDWCISKLGLKESHWIYPLEQTDVIIGEKSRLSDYRNKRYVLVTIHDEDMAGLSDQGWKSGIYLLEISAREAREILEEPN